MRIRPDNFLRIAYFIGTLVALSIGVTAGLKLLTAAAGVEWPWYIETPSVVTILGLLYALFDRHFWAWPFFRTIGLVDAPDLRGQWRGMIRSSPGEHQVAANLEIIQTASSIVVAVYTEQSASISTAAGFETRADGAVELHYIYDNRPQSGSPATMERHEGTARLTICEDGDRILEGSYYTGRGRHTDGTMRFEYARPRLAHRFIRE